jgi:hypothetical protein
MFSTLVDAKERPTKVTILVDRELRERRERAAQEHERSLGAETRIALRAHLDALEDESDA